MITPIDISGQSTYRGGALDGAPQNFIWHHTGSRSTPQGIVNTLNQRGLGVQYVMDRDGTIYKTLPDGARGAHIQNSPDGTITNHNSIGMEVIANNNNDLTPAQIQSGTAFGQQIAQQYPGIHFYGHGQVNPGHKEADEGLTLANATKGFTTTPGAPVANQAVTTTPVQDNRQIVFDELTKNAGLSPQQAVGVLWSMAGESGPMLNPKAYNPNDPGGSVGMGQWLGIRRTNLVNFAADNNMSVDDPHLQAKFITHELQSMPQTLAALKNAQTSEDATRIWTAQYERPKVDNSEERIKLASQVGNVNTSGAFQPGTATAAAQTQTPQGVQPGAPAPQTQTPRYPQFQPMTPQQAWGMSIGQALSSLGSGFGGGGGGAGAYDPPDQPAIRTAAMETPTPQTGAGQSLNLGQTLGASTLGGGPGAVMDPNYSITQGAPGMSSMLGQLGTPSNYNMWDPRATASPSTMFRGVRMG